MTKQAPASVDDYIKSFHGPTRKRLEALRLLIREVAPGVEERISYQMPTFFHNGNPVYFAGYEKHIGFYPGAEAVNKFRTELSRYKGAVGSIQFPLDQPLPVELIRRIVKYRLGQATDKTRKAS